MKQLIIDNIVVPGEGAPCDTWKEYYRNLKARFGRGNARTIWLLTWKRTGSASCTTNEDFNRFIKKHEIDVSSAATRAVADTAQIGENILGLGKNVSGALKLLVPVVLIGGVAVALYLAIKVAKNAQVEDLAMAVPQARMARMALSK